MPIARDQHDSDDQGRYTCEREGIPDQRPSERLIGTSHAGSTPVHWPNGECLKGCETDRGRNYRIIPFEALVSRRRLAAIECSISPVYGTHLIAATNSAWSVDVRPGSSPLSIRSCLTARPAFTRSTTLRRNSGGYGGRDIGTCEPLPGHFVQRSDIHKIGAAAFPAGRLLMGVDRKP
jgi:hypothetical protein